MIDHVHAPFTPDQVASLNSYQEAGLMHPFTCSNRDDTHRYTTDLGVLKATEAGWVCPDCTYTQDWAHLFMANWSWLTLY